MRHQIPAAPEYRLLIKNMTSVNTQTEASASGCGEAGCKSAGIDTYSVMAALPNWVNTMVHELINQAKSPADYVVQLHIHYTTKALTEEHP